MSGQTILCRTDALNTARLRRRSREWRRRRVGPALNESQLALISSRNAAGLDFAIQ